MGGAAREGGDGIAPGDVLARLEAAYIADETPFVLATVVRCQAPTSARPGDKAIVTSDGRLTGWIGGACAEPLVRHEAARALAEGTPRLIHIAPSAETSRTETEGELTVATTCASGGALDIFVEPRLPRPLLVVFGATPVARMLVTIADTVGFRTCAVAPGAAAADFPAAEAVLGDLDLGRLPPTEDTWAIVASMGHFDEDALMCALAARPPIHVGLVASARRAASVLAALRGRGVHEADLARVRTPAGGARAGTQAEIAVLALAEIVTLRAQARRAGPDPEWFAVDPVCGMSVDTRAAGALRGEREGRTYWFCSAGCRERFGAA